MRRSIVIAAVLVVIAFVFVGGPSLLFSPSTADVAPEDTDEPEPEIYTPDGSESGFWPYLNAREAHEKRSPLNVIVRGDTETIVRLLSEQGEIEWEETDHDHFDPDELVEAVLNDTDEDERIGGDLAEEDEDAIVSATDLPWRGADGATRLAYIDPGPNGEPFWTTETVQLEEGTYYGHRYHIRLYETPNPEDQWVVIQTHSEHFDWLTLRHRVHGVEDAQFRLERDLLSIPGVDDRRDVKRINLGNSGPSDADGWATKVDLRGVAAIVPIVIGLAARREGLQDRVESELDDRLTEVDRDRLGAVADRIEVRHLLLAVSIPAIVLGVRAAGLALDRYVDALTVHMIAGLLYPFIALGLPIATYLIARGLTRRIDAAIVASGAFAAAIWIDYALVRVDVLPVDVVLQRVLVVVALGLIAAGATGRARRESALNDLLIGGVAMWTIVLAAILFGYL